MSLKKMFKYLTSHDKQSISMRYRLLAYMMLLLIMAVAILVTGLVFSGVISMDDERVVEAMNMRLNIEEQQLKGEVDAITVQGINLAENLGRETEHFFTDNKININDLNNDIDSLSKLQNSYYGYMNTAIQVSDASGVYAIINATANTKIKDSDNSRSGVYLRVSNIDLKEKANKELNLYRGIADIGREKGLRMNNQWQLEFDMNRSVVKLPEGKVGDLNSEYSYTGKNKLVNMWEEVVLLAVPFAGTDGSAYGVCGLELSEALFSLWHPAFKSEYGPFVTVIAPYDGKTFYLDQGLVGGTKDTFLTDKEDFTINDNGKLTKMSSSYGEYVGVMKETDIFGDYSNSGSKEVNTENKVNSNWMLCVMMPESYYNEYMNGLRTRWMVILLLVIVISFVTSIILSRRYVSPVLSGMEALKGDSEGGEITKTGYSEIDDLIEFMKSQGSEEVIVEEKLPENVAILFDRFADNIKKLSPAEWIVMKLYIEGYEIADIPDKAFISMATVRKHNRNIYEKLEVASRDELMLYIDLFRRSNRLDELIPEEEADDQKQDEG
ncbi:regulatory protein, luxR family [Lachnospiraceae bacterium]|nr:regulatory protein, luxR family [Lachnospiraceae bacterium]